MSYPGRKAVKERKRGSGVVESGPSDPLVRIMASTGRAGVTPYKRTQLMDDTQNPITYELIPKKKKKPQVDRTEQWQTETAKLNGQFMDLLPTLTRKVLEANEADAAMATPCTCRRKEAVVEDGVETKKDAICEVQCHNPFDNAQTLFNFCQSLILSLQNRG
ncbi:hypothetical protein K438DRAFT_2023235 [Mycena galopus ATCC 62051]|nr:hypothetical protein K438DRAFT_2023235 [Mycena galopus ATCC 62051]